MEGNSKLSSPVRQNGVAKSPSFEKVGEPAKATSKDPSDDVSKPKRIKDKNGNHSDSPTYQVKLERVLGLTVPSNAALDCDPQSGLLAYPAGCTVVLLNTRKNRQSHLQNASKKTVTCVAFSSCGRYLATGECGHQPSVRVWDRVDKTQIAEFPGHKFGVSCVAFSPPQKYVVSVGTQHDMIVNVWDWRAGVKVASNKFSSKVKAISFAENGSYFVTVGNRHVKFWYLDVPRGAKFKEPVPLTGRSAILGEQRNNYFCDVACGRGQMGDSTFAITKSGLLCEFNNRRLLDKWVELRTQCANCIVAGEFFIFVGCADGIVRCFNPINLQFITTLPRTHYLGVDVSKGLTINHMSSHPNSAKYPDTIAITFDEVYHKVMAVYNDHSLYVWDVKDIKRVGKTHSYLYHSACIWGIEMCPPKIESRGAAIQEILPEGSLITCSSDDTMRVWNIDSSMPTNTSYERNIYSQDLLKIIYVDQDLNFIKDTDISPQGIDKNDASYDSRNGVRCIKVSPDGRHLASGDRAGNIRIHDLQFMDEICKIEAHDAEVLCLEYSRPETGYKFLSSASRDRLIHVFNVNQDYNFIQTIDDHSSAITSVRFYQNQGGLQMVSCSADRSIIFRSATQNPQNEVVFSRGHNVAGKTTLYDMEVDHGQRHILTACQDRNIRVYNVNSGKHSKTFKGSIGDDGTLIKVVMDSSGIYAATSCTDKNMCIYDYYSGECMATMFGHSELVTGLRFSNDGKHLISVSGDGCIFIWSLPHDMTQIITARLAQQAERAERALREQKKVQAAQRTKSQDHVDNGHFESPAHQLPFDSNANEPDEHDYRFSVGQLPLWAKKQIVETQTRTKATNSGPNAGISHDMPKGRWAQRLPNNPVTFKTHYDTDSVIPFPEKRMDSESSKESSLEDNQKAIPPQPPPRRNSLKNYDSHRDDFVPCPESLQEINMGEDAFQVPISKVMMKRSRPDLDLRSRHLQHLTDDSDVSSLRVDDPTTDHDGDIEDCDHDDESTGPEETSGHLLYYPADNNTVGDFTVNAMDVEELRRSQRRQRKSRPERPTDIPLSTVSGSQESDEEDEVSTPSADTAERNILSMLSMSSESIDRVGRRETFLKNTFESLQTDSPRTPKDVKNKNSISYRFTHRNRTDSTSSRREELLKKIEETRRKLDNIGYKSSLRSSKSISDLSNIPEKDTYGSHIQQGNEPEVSYSICPFVVAFPPALLSHIPQEFMTKLDSLSKAAHFQDPSGIYHLLGESKFTSGESDVYVIGGAIFDDTSVPKEYHKIGKKLLCQLESDLRELEKAIYGEVGPCSPLEIDADSLQESYNSTRNFKFPLQSSISNDGASLTETSRGSDSDTVKSDDESDFASNFSCDSLEDDDEILEMVIDNDQESCSSEVIERKKTKEKDFLFHFSHLSQSSTLPTRKSKWKKTMLLKNHYRTESDSNPIRSMGHSFDEASFFRVASDPSLVHSDGPGCHSEAQTPTNPPFFTVRSPSQPSCPPFNLVTPNSSKVSQTYTLEQRTFSLQRSASLATTPTGGHPFQKHFPAMRSASIGLTSNFPVIQAQPLPPGPPPSAYLSNTQLGIGAPGRAHRVTLAKKVAIRQVLPSKQGGSGDSGFSSGTSGAGSLRRACSLSDLNNPSSPRRLLPTPPNASGKKSSSRNSKFSRVQSSNLSRSSSIGVLNQSGDEASSTIRTPSSACRPTVSSMSKMTPRALKRKSSLSQAASTGDIRHLHDDSSSEEASPSDHKNHRTRGHSMDRRGGFPTRAVSERDLTRSNSLSNKSRGDSIRNHFANQSHAARRQVSASDISRPSSAASSSPEEFANRLDLDSAPLTVSLVESVCEWVVEGCERLSHLWWRTCSESEESVNTASDEDRHRALRSLLLGAAARATHALSPLTSPNPPLGPPPIHNNQHHSQSDSKDPRVIAMMQQYTDILVNMVQQKMVQHQNPPPGPT